MLSWLQRCKDLLNLFGLVQRSQATGTDFHSDGFAISHQGLLVDVGLKPGLSVTVRMADIVTSHSSFQTDFTAHYRLIYCCSGYTPDSEIYLLEESIIVQVNTKPTLEQPPP